MTSPNYNTFKQLQVERRERLLIIKFNDGEWQRRTIYELLRILDVANGDADVAIIVLTGNFEAGQSQSEETTTHPAPAKDKDEVEAREVQSRASSFVMRSLAKKLLLNRKLLVSCVQGKCVGLGVTICTLSDIVYASRSSQFDLSLNKIDGSGLVGLWTLSHLKLALESGELLDAHAAQNRGFVTGLLDDSQAGLAKFWQRLGEHSLLPIDSLMATKRLLMHPWHEKLLEALREEGTPQASAQRRGKL
ncbi:uncharacterized protein Dwil_GK25674 [Drosophila willistoni]|uniref:Enoyl-CoA hydratase n=1 Tax=Drosophila willistoni TaxID=7260 RepID=B4NEN5_DROWI|nr:uncharacterized protein LOC6649180 [Drosophila willistoni]EDW82204.1 uncharacterized protein Dwil_GK25674 [Drosophila willistoni]